MVEDVDRIDETGADEEESEPEEEIPEDEAEKAEKKEARKISLRTNPFGLILNLRMLRRIVQIIAFIGVNGYILLAWFRMPNVQDLWLSIWNNLPTLPILAPLEAPFGVIAGSFDTMLREFTSGIFPFFTLGAMIIILIIIGRAPCGWICPIGTIQDFVTLPKRTKTRPTPGTESELRKVKAYVFVVVAFFAVWVGLSRLTGTAAVDALGGATNSIDCLISVRMANVLTSTITVEAYIERGGSNYYLIKNAPIVSGGSLELIDGGSKIVLASGDQLYVKSDTASSLDTVVGAVDDIST